MGVIEDDPEWFERALLELVELGGGGEEELRKMLASLRDEVGVDFVNDDVDEEEDADDAGSEAGGEVAPEVADGAGNELGDPAFAVVPVSLRRKNSLNYSIIDSDSMERLFDVRINQFDHVFDNLEGGKKIGQVRNVQGHLLMANCPCHGDKKCKLLLKAEGSLRPDSRASIIKWLVSSWETTYEEHFAQTVALRARFNMPAPARHGSN